MKNVKAREAWAFTGLPSTRIEDRFVALPALRMVIVRSFPSATNANLDFTPTFTIFGHGPPPFHMYFTKKNTIFKQK